MASAKSKNNPRIISKKGIVSKSVSKYLKELNLPHHLIAKMQHSIYITSSDELCLNDFHFNWPQMKVLPIPIKENTLENLPKNMSGESIDDVRIRHQDQESLRSYFHQKI